METGMAAGRKPRQSNMELLRMVSMFLVLLIHANTSFAPWPIGQEEVLASPLACTVKFLIESLCVVCVNAFILLSGWFGIRFSLRRLLSFVFQVLFYSLLLQFLPGTEPPSLQSFIEVFTLDQYWFVKAYIILFILSPALNTFAEQASRKTFVSVLVLYFIMQTLFGYISNTDWYSDGFSPLPFIGLYLLARYVRIHQPGFSRWGKGYDAAVYLGLSFLITILSIFLFRYFNTGGRLFNYTDPLVICSSLFFVLFFSKIKMGEHRWINAVAISSVGAYLLHMHPRFFMPYFCDPIRQMFSSKPMAIAALLTFAWVLLVFCTGVLLDKVRWIIWSALEKPFSKQD